MEQQQMSNPAANKNPDPDASYQDWLTYCKIIATDAKFRGLLTAYFAGHRSEDYGPLAVGAQEILRQVVDGILDENQGVDASGECRLKDLIYAGSRSNEGRPRQREAFFQMHSEN
jgi:hypothetical protein